MADADASASVCAADEVHRSGEFDDTRDEDEAFWAWAIMVEPTEMSQSRSPEASAWAWTC
jgi:hypothetical protein